MNVNNFNFKVGSHEEIKKLAKRVGEDIGDLRKLITTTREDLIAAINELKQEKSDIIGRIEVLEELHKKPVDQGPASEYPGTGWYKATDTGVVYSRGVPHGEIHTFDGDPVEYIALSDTGLDPTAHGSDFQNALKEFQANLHRYAISDVTDLSYALSSFNNSDGYDGEFKEVDLSHWDTSSVTKTFATFGTVINTRIKGLENWDMSKVENMDYMFRNSEAVEFSDISGWDTSSVNSMQAMFEGVVGFNQDLSQWCVANIPSEPQGFATGTEETWTLPKPSWGTCPRGEDQAQEHP